MVALLRRIRLRGEDTGHEANKKEKLMADPGPVPFTAMVPTVFCSV